jgi:protein O-mannosyl-transferase
MKTDMRQNILIALLLLAAVFVSYSSAFESDFVWDDEFLVVTNPLVRAPLWSFQPFKQDIVNSSFRHSVYYRPVQILTYALDYRLWGMSPPGYHFTNILLHFANAFLVFLLALRLSRDKITSFLCGLFFAVHPQQTGAVSFVSARADLLFFFFGFLYMLFFLRGDGKGKKGPVFASVLFLLLALLSKESAVMFPFIMLAVGTICFGRRIPLRLYVPGFLAVSVYALFRIFIIKAGTGGVFSGVSLPAVAGGYAAMAGRALWQIFSPAGLHFRSIGVLRPGEFAIVSGILIAAALTVFLKEKRKTLFAALAFFLAALVPPAVSYAKFGVFAEQWMYLSSFGIFLFVSVSLSGILLKRGAFSAGVVSVLVLSAVAFLAGSTRAYSAHWKDTYSLSERVLSSSPEDRVAVYYKATALEGTQGLSGSLDIMRGEKSSGDPVKLYLKGRIALAAGEVEEARRDFVGAIALKPGYSDAYTGMAFVCFVDGDSARGASYLRKALEADNSNREALLFLSRYHLAQREAPDALYNIEKALKLYPYNHEIIMAAGDVYAAIGNMPESTRQYIKASRLYPERAEAYYSVGRVFYLSGETEEGMVWAREAVMADPSYQPAIEFIRKARDPD